MDGTKIAANASKDANRTEAAAAGAGPEILAEAEAADAAEDELYGDARGDELPPELADPVTRRERIRAALAGLDAEREAAQETRERSRPGAYRERQGRLCRPGARQAGSRRTGAADRETARYQAKTAARRARARRRRRPGAGAGWHAAGAGRASTAG